MLASSIKSVSENYIYAFSFELVWVWVFIDVIGFVVIQENGNVFLKL